MPLKQKLLLAAGVLIVTIFLLWNRALEHGIWHHCQESVHDNPSLSILPCWPSFDPAFF